jgi:hypothetical protein
MLGTPEGGVHAVKAATFQSFRYGTMRETYGSGPRITALRAIIKQAGLTIDEFLDLL